jgi:tetratricopeptide (TPR) repeat protein
VVGLLVALTAVAGSVGWVVRDRAERRSRIAGEVQVALAEARRYQKEGKWPQADALSKQAEALLASAGGTAELQRRVREVLADLQMVARLEEVRLQRSAVKDDHFDVEAEDRAYAAAFRDYGIDVETLDHENAASRIAASEIRVELAAALDGWAETRRFFPQEERTRWQDLLGLASAADPDPWRRTLRDAVLRGDCRAVLERAASRVVLELPPGTVVLLATCLREMNAHQEATELLWRAQERHPGDFWMNHTLAFTLVQRSPPHWSEAIPFFTAAVALRPDSPGARLNLGHALAKSGQLEEAVSAYREAIRLKPDYAMAYHNLALAMETQGRLDYAVAYLRQAVKLKPDYAEALCDLGVVYWRQGRLDEAEACLRQSVEQKPNAALSQYNLGNVLTDQSRFEEAIVAYRKATTLQLDFAEAHCNLGAALWAVGRLDEAIVALRQAVELKPDLAIAYYDLGGALSDKSKFDEAAADLRKAIELKGDYAEAFNKLGLVLYKMGQFGEAANACLHAVDLKPDLEEAHLTRGLALRSLGRLDEAIAEYSRAIELKPDYVVAHCNLGNALADLGRFDESFIAYRRAIELRPDFVTAHFNLGRSLTDNGRLDEAVEELWRVIDLRPDYPEAHYDLGNALWKMGRLDEATAAFRKAIQLRPGYAQAYCNLGGVLRQQGAFAEALAALMQGHELGSRCTDWSYPSAQWVKECQRLLEIDGMEQAVLQGVVKPATAAEQNEYAQLFYCKKRYLAATRLWTAAFTADPQLAEDLNAGYRNEAAYAAALVAAGRGVDAGQLDDTERVRWRRQCLEWLIADLAKCGKLLEEPKPDDRRLILQRLGNWRSDHDLACLRDPDSLAELPVGEREAFGRFWAEVETMYRKASVSR